MLNEFDTIIAEIIWDRATEAHAARCASPDTCSNWHIRNDYVPRIRREVIAEVSDALSRTSKA